MKNYLNKINFKQINRQKILNRNIRNLIKTNIKVLKYLIKINQMKLKIISYQQIINIKVRIKIKKT